MLTAAAADSLGQGGRSEIHGVDSRVHHPGVRAAATWSPATRRLVAPLLDAPRTRGRPAEPRSAARPGSLPRGTPPLLASGVRLLAPVSATLLCSPDPGR